MDLAESSYRRAMKVCGTFVRDRPDSFVFWSVLLWNLAIDHQVGRKRCSGFGETGLGPLAWASRPSDSQISL